jgi:hypothetical protein
MESANITSSDVDALLETILGAVVRIVPAPA